MRIALYACMTAVLACSCATTGHKSGLVYLDVDAPIEERVEDALSRMTLEEKVAVLHAQSKFSSAGVPRLGIPDLWCTDGPHGIRPEVLWDEWNQAGWTNDSCTAFPALTCLAATWDKSLSSLYGKSIGEEAQYRNKDVLLGPGVNIYRSPLNGRNFEYMGEDPYLSSKMVVPYVQGVQSNGVAACVKHFAVNNQEAYRMNVNVNVDDRTLYELYLPAFEAAVREGGAWAIMGSYNLYKNQHCCHNQYLLNDILKGEWGFDGVVVSDWGGTHDTDQAISNGLDLEFGTWTDGLKAGRKNAYDTYYLADAYLERLRSGQADMKVLDDKVRRVLRLQMRTNMGPRHFGRFTCESHSAAARKIGADGIVLLKNDGVLPIDTASARNILVVGENAIKMMTVGGGSSSLKTKYEILPLEGIRNAFAGKSEVRYERGYIGDVSGEYNGVTSGQNLSESRSTEELVADAVKAACVADYVIFVGGLNKAAHQDCEGDDRLSYELPYGQDAVIEAIAAAAPGKTIVVNISGNAVAMPWLDKVSAVLQDWYIGSEAGNSLADVLTGKVNPSGKLPFTMPYSLADDPLHTERQYPGLKRDSENILDEYYDEGIFVGYRWYEKKGIRPMFPFGHGLSYTTFVYGSPKVSKSSMTQAGTVKISMTVTNSGKRAGAEVVQLYVSDKESSVERPVKELKGFEKVYLQPGESREVSFTLTSRDLSYFDAALHKWVAEPGMFDLMIGSSSEDIRVSVPIELKAE